MNMCAAFAALGHEVELVTKTTPSRVEHHPNPFVFYGLPEDFTINCLSRPRPRGGGLVFAAAIRRLLKRRLRSCDVAYCRDLVAARLAVRYDIPTVFEAHAPPESRLARQLWLGIRKAPALLGLVTISKALADEFSARRLQPANGRTLVAPDGASERLVESVPPRRDAQTDARGLQIAYVGNLYRGRGVPLLHTLARALPMHDFHVVGGTADAIDQERVRAPRNLRFHGFLPPAQLAQRYGDFDLLLMPHERQVRAATGTTDIARWMSPLKMFEYMATGRAIVASDLPVLREVLKDGHNARLVPPDELQGWIEAVRGLAEDAETRRSLGANARIDLLKHYTWEERARRIEQFWLEPRSRR